jgi:D-alanyl-D-alanine carboxypeptidase
MKKNAIILLVIAIAVGAWFFMQGRQATPSSQQPDAVSQQGFDKKQFSLTDPASLWVIANKQRPLQPKTYAPGDLVTPSIPLRLAASSEEMQLRKPAADALKQMYDAALADGQKLMVSSAYRSYTYQDNLYKYYVKQQGQSTADTQSARPGHSEHQTGLAVDLEPASRTCEIETCFAETSEGKWVAQNAYKYGFVIRYIEGKQNITGYIYEPWH